MKFALLILALVVTSTSVFASGDDVNVKLTPLSPTSNGWRMHCVGKYHAFYLTTIYQGSSDASRAEYIMMAGTRDGLYMDSSRAARVIGPGHWEFSDLVYIP